MKTTPERVSRNGAIWALFAAAIAQLSQACSYQPQIDDCTVRCDAHCPEGFSCMAGLCVLPGDAPSTCPVRVLPLDGGAEVTPLDGGAEIDLGVPADAGPDAVPD